MLHVYSPLKFYMIEEWRHREIESQVEMISRRAEDVIPSLEVLDKEELW